MRTQSIRAALGLATLLVATAAFAGDVYEWKDASGVTHYSQTPPANGKYKERTISGRREDPTLTPAADATSATSATPASPLTQAAAARSGESAQCVTARTNLVALEGKAIVQQDTNGDGKPDKTLNEAERADQIALAKATLKANCAASQG